jgi:chromosome segregation ATPase
LSRIEESELSRTAAALQSELTHLESIAEEVRGHRLDSAKNIQRAGRLLQRASDGHERLSAALSALVAAIGTAQRRQEGALRAISEFGTEVGARHALYNEIAGTFEALGGEAAELNLLMARGPEVVGEVKERLTSMIETAGAIAERAEAGGFRDLSRDAIGRKEQLTAAVKRLGGA